jgi:hypothetical protein
LIPKRLQMPLFKKNCSGCKKNKKPGLKRRYSFITGIFLILLPKCPFCVMAYTSTVMLCGKDTLTQNSQHHYSSLTFYITFLLCLVTIIGILFNYRDVRTKYALTIAGLGTSITLFSVLSSGGQYFYYTGVFVLFIAVWLNGSLLSFLKQFNNNIFIKKTDESITNS